MLKAIGGKEFKENLRIKFIEYMDELGAELGARPNISKYLFKDFQLWRKLVFGPCVSYQYRIEGRHKWPGAREAILGVEERIKKPFTSWRT